VPLVQIEAVAHEVLVRNDEADVPDRKVVDEAAVGTVEQRRDGERRRPPELEQLPQLIQGQACIHDVLDHEHVTIRDRSVQILQQPDPLMAARRGAAVAGKLHEIELVQRSDRSRQIGDEEQGPLERGDEHEVEALVIVGDLGAELADAPLDLLGGKVGLADAQVVG
jgi:hypothetical protein